jgi:hypothetical protein
MKTPQNSAWTRLVHAARQPSTTADARPETAPFGFSTRVAAQAFAAMETERVSSLFSRYAWRALGVSCVLMTVCVFTSLRPIMTAIEEETAELTDTSIDSDSTDIS